MDDKVDCPRCNIYKRLLKAKDELLMCYRVGRRPTEKTFKELEICKKLLEEE